MFNAHSRWDRRFPKEEHEPGEMIDVWVVFRKGQIEPTCFVWHNRKYHVSKVTYQWEDRLGEATLYFFSVICQENLYQIHFNNKHLHWRLDKVAPL